MKTPQEKPPLRCRIFGHVWFIKCVNEKTHPGYVHTVTKALQHCMKCGKPNPMWDKL